MDARFPRSACLFGLLCFLFCIGALLFPNASQADDSGPATGLSDRPDDEMEESQGYFPAYIVDKGRMLAIYSNRKWKRSSSGNPASEIKMYPNSTYGSDPAFYVWAGKCRTAQQTVVLVRNVVLPGPPKNLKVFFSATYSTSFSARIYFNEKLAYEADPLTDIVLPDAVAKFLHEGENSIKIYLTKKANPYACDYFSGVFFGFEGYFEADLRVGVPKENPVYTLRRGGINNIKIGNLGPSIVKAAEFVVDINPHHWYGDNDYEFELLFLGKTGSFIKSCELAPPKWVGDLYRLHCKIENIRPKDVGWVKVGVRFTPTQIPFDYEDVFLGWGISKIGESWEGPNDPNTENNTSWVNYVFCDKLSSQSKCQELVKP